MTVSRMSGLRAAALTTENIVSVAAGIHNWDKSPSECVLRAVELIRIAEMFTMTNEAVKEGGLEDFMKEVVEENGSMKDFLKEVGLNEKEEV